MRNDRHAHYGFIVLGVSIAILILSNRFLLHDRPASFFVRYVSQPAAKIFLESNIFRLTIGKTIQAFTTAQENIKLQQENLSLTHLAAQNQVMQEENDFLRQALRLAEKTSVRMLPARIFQQALGPAGIQLTINQGQRQGVSLRDPVISGEGVLIGEVFEVLDHSARIRILTDLNFSVAARVLGSPTVGIAKGALKKGLDFSLIAQNDLITEGNTVVSSGDDTFPAGLLVGTVSRVQTSQTTVFKQVYIHPAVSETLFGQVLVLLRQ